MTPDSLEIDLESLRCFEAAAVHGSFRTAAKATFLSAPAFSERIRQLESRLNIRLFKRSPRGVELTKVGVDFLGFARRCLNEARRCVDFARHPDQRPTCELVLGTPFNLGMSWLVPSLDTLNERTPQRTLRLRFGTGETLTDLALKGRVDAIITSHPAAHAHLRYASIHDEVYYFVGSPDLLAKAPLSAAADACQHTLLDLAPDLPNLRYLLDVLAPEPVWSFRRVDYLGISDAVRLRVLAGAGVAVLPRHIVARDVEAARLVRLLPDVELASDHFRLAWPGNHPQEAEILELASELRDIPLPV